MRFAIARFRFLLIIGPNWQTECDEHGVRRINDPDDYVRREALAAKKNNVRIIPLVVDDAAMPAASDLPQELKFLSKRNALPICLISFAIYVNTYLS
jgi:hypothetical protein